MHREAINPSLSMRDPSRARLTTVMLGVVIIAGAILMRAVYIQIIRDNRLEAMSRKQFQSKYLIRPHRGLILDRNGEPLAINIETNSLAANPSKIRDKHFVARLVSKVIDLPVSKVLSKLNEKREFVWLKRHIPDSDLNRFRKWHLEDADGAMISGLWLVKENQRIYPHRELAAHILGSVNVDTDGLEGIELWQNEILRGKVASVTAIKDALGRPTFIDAVAAKAVKDGEPVTLTIDASLQFSVEQELKAALRKTASKSGTAIVMNAVTGEILALANEPAFDPNQNAGPSSSRRNRALTDGYEPGSTLKSVLLASALSHGWKLTDQVWGGHGQIKVQGKIISEAEAKEMFEWLSLKKMMQVSSNVAASRVALKLGSEKYAATLKNFGFGARTGLGFPGEIPGHMPPRRLWQPLALANIGFGQGILVTPLQMTQAYAVFANGGWLVQPTLIKTPDLTQRPPRRVLGSRINDQVVEALETVTQTGGTGIKAGVEGFRIAGKTGTAQVVDPATGRYSHTKHFPSFIGFPIGLEQKFVIFAALEEPRGIYYAADTAAPLFHEIFSAVANRFSLPATEHPIRSQPRLAHLEHFQDTLRTFQSKAVSPEAHSVEVSTEQPKIDLIFNSAGEPRWLMPSLVGLTAREASRILDGHDFQLEVHGTGVIRTQSPPEHSPIAQGETIKIGLAEP